MGDADALIGIVILLLACFVVLPLIVLGLCVGVDKLEETFNQKQIDDDQNMDKDSGIRRDSGHGGDAWNDSRTSATAP